MLIQEANKNAIEIKEEINDLIKEGYEFIRIFSSSILTSEKNRGIKK